MQPKCSECQSISIKKISLIYEGGTRTRSSDSVRVSNSKRRTKTYTSTKSVFQTAQASKFSPPQEASCGEAIGILLFIGLIGGYFYTPVLPIALLLGIGLYKKAYNYNNYVYPYIYRKWDNKYQCQRCGNVFMLFYDEKLEAYEKKSKSFLFLYFIVLLTLPVAIFYQYTKKANSDTPTVAATTIASVNSSSSAPESDDDIAKIAKQNAIKPENAQPNPTPEALPALPTNEDISSAANQASGQDQGSTNSPTPLYPLANTLPPPTPNVQVESPQTVASTS